MNTKAIYLLIILLSISFYLKAQVDTSFYSVVSKGTIKGFEKNWKVGKNETHYSYQFNDRGRGDSTFSILKTNEYGFITQVDIRGKDYMKNIYSETYSIQGDSSVWAVNNVKKTKKNNQEIYAPSGGDFTLYEWVYKYALNQPTKRIKILPDGFIHVDNPISKTIKYDGKKLKLKLCAIYFEPSTSPFYIWFKEDMQFFGQIDSWTSLIQKGYENWTEELFKIQELSNEAFYINEIKNNSITLKNRLVFTHANLFQSADASVKENMTIEVETNKIKAIYSSNIKRNGQANDTIIDCKGKFLMPGLWDMHGHYYKDDGIFYLAGGVTHVRDMGNEKNILIYKKQIKENKLLGPDLSYLSLLLDKADIFQSPTGKIVKTLDEGFKAIDEYTNLGYQQLKIYSSIEPSWVKPLTEYAHKKNMKVAGHVPSGLKAEDCIKNGYDEITHLNFVFLNFMGDTVGNLKSMARFTAVGENARNLDLQSNKVQNFIDLMKANKTSIDPTLNIWQKMFAEFKGDTSHTIKPIINWLPETRLSDIAIKNSIGTEENKPHYKASFNNMLRMIKLLYDNGIFIVAGTDGGNAIALHHELELYVEAGIPANQVLKIATYNAAKDCNLLNQFGEIKVGVDADFILIDGNPVKQISDIRRVEFVVKNKRIYSPKKLLATQGWKYYY